MARQALHHMLVVVTGLAALLAPTMPAQAGVEVTDCTETGLQSALAIGGVVTFNCGGTHAPASIALSTNQTILTNISLDGSNGGNTVVLGNPGISVMETVQHRHRHELAA